MAINTDDFINRDSRVIVRKDNLFIFSYLFYRAIRGNISIAFAIVGIVIILAMNIFIGCESKQDKEFQAEKERMELAKQQKARRRGREETGRREGKSRNTKGSGRV